MKEYLTLFFLIFLFIFSFSNFVNASEKQLYISEIFYNADGNDTGKEYVVITNDSGSQVDMTGWDIDLSSAPYFTFPSFILSSHSSIILRANTEGVDTEDILHTGLTSNMSNTKGPIALFSSTEHTTENLVDYVSYGLGGLTNESKAVANNLWEVNKFIPLPIKGNALLFDGTTWQSFPPTYFSNVIDEIVVDTIENKVEEENEETLVEDVYTIEEEKDFDEDVPLTQKRSISQSKMIPVEKSVSSKPIFKKNEPMKIITGLVIDAPTNAIAGETIRFDATKSDFPGDDLPYIWELGDGNGLEGIFTEYTYNATGTYDIILSTNFNGKKYSKTHNIMVTTEEDNTSQLLLSEISNLPNKSFVTVSGIVIVPPEHFAQTYFYIVSEYSDDENIVRGIKVKLPRNGSLELVSGDVLAISGTYTKSGDEHYIRVLNEDDVSISNTGTLPHPTLFSLEFIDDTLLGSYITITGEVIQKKGNNIYIDDGVEEIRAYIYPNTNIDKSQISKGDIIDISGILSKTRSGFRLLPVGNDDVQKFIEPPTITEQLQIEPVADLNTKNTFMQFLAVSIVALLIFIILMTLKINKRKLEIHSFEK